ncbi:MAG: hypothetical protein D6744_04615 [Planctomycetota bacterium]|nr:MAG: hypothetical protein D6744_04615 [Planctomycetota bacterium]
MNKKLYACLGAIVFLAATAGCSATGAAWEGFRIGKNLAKKDSYLRIWLDGNEAKQNKLKKGYFGYASFEVKGKVSTKPTFKFDFIEGKNFGRITSTNMQIHKEFEADYSHQAEFVIYPANPNDSTTLMKPGVEYPLGAMPSNMKVMNFEKQTVPGVELQPGLEYLLVFTVAGDRSESVQVLFNTK